MHFTIFLQKCFLKLIMTRMAISVCVMGLENNEDKMLAWTLVQWWIHCSQTSLERGRKEGSSYSGSSDQHVRKECCWMGFFRQLTNADLTTNEGVLQRHQAFLWTLCSHLWWQVSFSEPKPAFAVLESSLRTSAKAARSRRRYADKTTFRYHLVKSVPIMSFVHQTALTCWFFNSLCKLVPTH